MAFIIVPLIIFAIVNAFIVFDYWWTAKTETFGEAISLLLHWYSAQLEKIIPPLKRRNSVLPRNLKMRGEWAADYLLELISQFNSGGIARWVKGEENSWQRESNIRSMAYTMHYVAKHVDGVSPALRSHYSIVLGDIVALLDMIPSTYVQEQEYYDSVRSDFTENGVMDTAIATPFYGKLMEIRPHLEEVEQAVRDEIEARKEAKDSAINSTISSFVPASTVLKVSPQGTANIPAVNTASMSKGERDTYKLAMAKMADLPLIESERMKRILADTAEAQALAKEAKSKGEVSFDGRSPEEMVSAILAGNAEMITRTLAAAQGSQGQSAADRLWELERFTEEKVARG